MRNPFQSNVRRPWLLLSATLLLAYSLAPYKPSGGFDFNAVATFLEILMFLISFPLSLVALLASDEFGGGPITRSQFWALALALGYFQWFHLAPFFLRRRSAPALTLNLAADPTVASAVRVAPPHTREPAPYSPPSAALTAADAPPVPQFNERGRTPLERVFEDEA
jgi:hypothetical protein